MIYDLIQAIFTTAQVVLVVYILYTILKVIAHLRGAVDYNAKLLVFHLKETNRLLEATHNDIANCRVQLTDIRKQIRTANDQPVCKLDDSQ